MKAKSFVAIFLVLSVAFLPAFALASYVPRQGDYFNYHEVESLSNGTGSYAGYTEQTVVDGKETMNSASADGVVSATYSYSYTWSNSSGSTETGSESGSFTFSSATFLYVNGTDDQTGYVNPSVWFFMDDSTPTGGSFTILNTPMKVTSTNYDYYLPSQNKDVNTIYVQGSSSYQRNDVYGQFTADYTWKAYFDPSTGYIVGYDYVEQDTNPSGDGFTLTDTLYVTSTSYSLSAGAVESSPSPSIVGPTVSLVLPIEGNGSLILVLIAFIVVIAIIIIAIVAYALSRRRKKLPKHSAQPAQPQYTPRPPPAPPTIDLTPKQPPVQQVVIKEVVKVKCRYCGALIDSTAETCPVCGAPRT